MSTNLHTDLEAFHRYIAEQIASGHRDLSPEGVLEAWRSHRVEAEEFEETVEAIGEAIHDLESGKKGQPFEEFDRRFRERHQLPPRQ